VENFISNGNDKDILNTIKDGFTSDSNKSDIKDGGSIEKKLEGFKPSLGITWKSVIGFFILSSPIIYSFISETFVLQVAFLLVASYAVVYSIGLVIGVRIKNLAINTWLVHIFGLQFVLLSQNILTLFRHGGGLGLLLTSVLIVWFVVKPGLWSLLGNLLYIIISDGLIIMLMVWGLEPIWPRIMSLIPSIILIFVILYVVFKRLYKV
jgi:hypothetical protein